MTSPQITAFTHSEEDRVSVVVGEGEQEEGEERGETPVEYGRAHLSQGRRRALFPVKCIKVKLNKSRKKPL